MNLNKLENVSIYSKYVKVFIGGMSVGGLIVFLNMNYIHESPIGGFVFKDDKVYNLCEVDGTDVKLTTKGK